MITTSKFSSLDMIYEGLKLQARRLALQYGDGLALAEFWKDGLHYYNRHKKVNGVKEGFISLNSKFLQLKTTIIVIFNFLFFLLKSYLVQYKYCIQFVLLIKFLGFSTNIASSLISSLPWREGALDRQPPRMWSSTA
jgi:hypothetical protein